MTLECSVEPAANQSVIVTVCGDVDLATASALETCVRGTLNGASAVVIDMAGVTFLDSSGLRSLVTLRSEAQSKGTSIALRDAPKHVRRVFALTGLSASFGLGEDD